MVDMDDLSSDGQDTLDDDASRFVENTYDEDNYGKWGDNAKAAADGEDGFTSATAALANRYGFSENDISQYDEDYTSGTKAAVEEDRYEKGLKTFATEDEADDQWAERFLSGLR